MIVTHTFRAQGICPANGSRDHYGIEVTCTTLLLVEGIVKAAGELLAAPVYQEAFTQALADKIACRVVTQCRHGDVLTRCECEPGEQR